jgi:hypothetical protein
MVQMASSSVTGISKSRRSRTCLDVEIEEAHSAMQESTL